MHEVAQLLVLLVAYYATFGIMGIGFATMVAGKDGAAAAGNFFFVRPLQCLGQQAWFACTALLVASWTLLLHRVVDEAPERGRAKLIENDVREDRGTRQR